MRTRPAPAAVLAALVALAACQPQQPEDGEPDRRFLGTHPSCQQRPDRPPTRPFQTISVEDGEVVVNPDTVVQPPKAGIFGWTSARHSWRITYEGGRSPIDPDSVVKVGGGRSGPWAPGRASVGTGDQASAGEEVSVSGRPGELVFAFVPEDAACRYYKFSVAVWGGDLDDTLTVDPGDLVQPYSY
jgi:hypothetical protein